MKNHFTCFIFILLTVISVSAIAQPEGTYSDKLPVNLVVPAGYDVTTGTGTFLGPLSNAQRTYQLLIHSSQLAGLTGKYLTGFSMRIPASATANWPTSTVTFANYDIYLSGSVDPSARSLTFANNIVGTQTQVRSGSLVIAPNSYTFGGSPNAFGPEITFNTPWLYSGGNVLVEYRHQGFTGTSRSTDAILTSTSGYGTLFSGCWTGSYTGTSGSQGNFTVLKFTGADLSVLNLTALIEGMYNGGTNLMVRDTAKIILRLDAPPYNIADASVSVLDSTGNGTFNFFNVVDGTNYYIVVNHRNSVETWSSSGNSFSGNVLNYNFTTSASQAYGNNQTLKGSRYTIYSGDVNKDAIIDGSDGSIVDNDATNFVTGYTVTDVNGDTIVDGSDAAIVDNNSANFISIIRP